MTFAPVLLYAIRNALAACFGNPCGRWLSRRATIAAAACAVLVATSGCSDGRPDRVPVAGRVLIDGQPVEHGFVRFVPDDTRPSVGALGKDGRFQLGCYEDADGVVLGKHRVEIAASEPLGPNRTRWHAPKKYANFTSSGVEQEITGATDSVEINLSWAGGKPFVEGPAVSTQQAELLRGRE